jgi:hypothetical protein
MKKYSLIVFVIIAVNQFTVGQENSVNSDSIIAAKRAYYKTHPYNVDTLIQELASNNYPKDLIFGMPILTWDDIPKLLVRTNDITMLTAFPVNYLSSDITRNCYFGVITMWLIESIRIAEEKGGADQMQRFPSLNPVIHKNGYGSENPASNDENEIEKLSLIYLQWWTTAKNMDRKEACKLAPLIHTDYSW